MKKKHFTNFALIVSLMVAGFVFLGGCDPFSSSVKNEESEAIEIEIEERISCDWVDIIAYRGHNLVAHYHYELDPHWRFTIGNRLTYYNSQGKDVDIYLKMVDDNPDVVKSVNYDGLVNHFDCSEKENEGVCNKAAEKVKDWKPILEWDMRIPRILEKIKNINPEDYLD